jgi:hypothetical protein
MIDSQTEERSFNLAAVAAVALDGDGKHCLEGASIRGAATTKPKHAGKATEIARPETQPPHVLEIEVNCEECGGSGFDPGGIDPWGPEPCPACRGAKTRRITRNYLAEAFQIAANPASTRPVERQHLVAVIQHCRKAISALVILPEVA